MQRKLNALTLAVGLTGAAATGALMTVAHAQTKTTPSSSSAAQGVPAAVTSQVPAATGADGSATSDSLAPAQQAVTTTRHAPAATSGAS